MILTISTATPRTLFTMPASLVGEEGEWRVTREGTILDSSSYEFSDFTGPTYLKLKEALMPKQTIHIVKVPKEVAYGLDDDESYWM